TEDAFACAVDTILWWLVDLEVLAAAPRGDGGQLRHLIGRRRDGYDDDRDAPSESVDQKRRGSGGRVRAAGPPPFTASRHQHRDGVAAYPCQRRIECGSIEIANHRLNR